MQKEEPLFEKKKTLIQVFGEDKQMFELLFKVALSKKKYCSC